MTPVERVVYDDGRVEVGAFRCPAGHRDFHDAGAIRDHHVFVFPRTSVWIRHGGGHPFLADPGVVTLYNPRQPYTREPLDAAGDVCDWFAVDSGTAAEAVGELDPEAAERPHRAFRFSHGPSDAATYLAQRRLFERLARGAPADALEVAEQVLGLLRRVLVLAYRARRQGARPAGPGTRAGDREAVEAARRVLAGRFRDPVSLPEIAREAGRSPYRLCRAFRRTTGTTLHAYREQLRMRAALTALADRRQDLTALALDLGYSSHSHFTANFGRVFGMPPSAVRNGLGAAGPE